MTTTKETCPENCNRCSGEFCEQHGPNPCRCDVIERHKIITKETCPKCGAKWNGTLDPTEVHFKCGSYHTPMVEIFHQSDRCRITELEKEKADGAELIKTASEVISKVRELEKEVERLREVLTESVTVMNGCKGLLFKSSEFMNRLYACVDHASALLQKKG
jgi:hypothetical protein